MDDALAQTPQKGLTIQNNAVLILVVMDDALARVFSPQTKKNSTRLNPCCNG